MPSIIEEFRQALGILEETGEAGPMTQLYAQEPTLTSLGRHYSGKGAVEEFWTEYRNQFSRIKSSFTDQIDDENKSALFWGSNGELVSGRSISYRGVSLIKTNGDLIESFETIYDSAAFVLESDK